jgi:hypothetical protein
MERGGRGERGERGKGAGEERGGGCRVQVYSENTQQLYTLQDCGKSVHSPAGRLDAIWRHDDLGPCGRASVKVEDEQVVEWCGVSTLSAKQDHRPPHATCAKVDPRWGHLAGHLDRTRESARVKEKQKRADIRLKRDQGGKAKRKTT